MSQNPVGGNSEAAAVHEIIPPETARNRAVIAVGLPLAVALLVGVITGAFLAPTATSDLPNAAPLFAALGVVSWLIGLRFYGLRGMGLRGGRPLFAGIGFAVLVWVVVLIVRRYLSTVPQVSFIETGQAVVQATLQVEIVAYRSAGAGRAFIYLLLFEAFATQLWAFGTAFRALADWRGPLTAAVAGGILFGATGFLLFRESFAPGLPGLIFFLLWGVVYGIIRLRTGSILGIVLVQALQSFTTWYVLQPPADMAKTGIEKVYLAVSLMFVIIIWRLWPKQESDYRV